MIHDAWIARHAASALGCFGHRIRIPPRAVGRLGPASATYPNGARKLIHPDPDSNKLGFGGALFDRLNRARVRG